MGRSKWTQTVLASLLFSNHAYGGSLLRLSEAAGALLVGRATVAGTADPATISPWAYKGCYSDNAAGGKALGTSFPADKSMTVESCIAKCVNANKNFTIAGMEYAQECYCDSYIRYNPTLLADSACSSTCTGNSSEKCGAGSKLSVYSIGDLQAWTPPAPVTTGLPDGWYSSGCWKEGSTKTRNLPYLITSANNNTNLGCINLCAKFGYTAAGTEYGTQCFCGDIQNIIDANATKAPDQSVCKTMCSADANLTTGGTICGGGSVMNLYTYNKTMYTWNYASGNDAGSYNLLFSGPIIPLVSQPGRNGKITLLEKSPGTPGTTGAYELDLFDRSSNKTAFRTMNVQSNIFCSASLTLPDKAGRQINVGGWAGSSTQGIRLYAPDGKPGTPGKNNWQENSSALHLLDHRWYPSAMIMPNGSILVVGGEVGSNGDAVPTLEILPDPNKNAPLPLNPIGTPTLWFDWLNNTDPYNLYPFLTVTPSGGIAVFYWNQGRILNKATFDTTTTLPVIPGAVNRPDGGRTYPLSGTAMLFPQYEPYNKEDFTVLLCGGSTTGPSMPIDNCVSIQPDAPNPQWTLERMPSKRVMPCMTALPDGTFLINNGALAGVAGFGLASNPNLNAVLYDPKKPVNSRMTVLANTTIARLYHSESVLLDDGSVLVTGSDPEDNKGNPQEYRYEIFLPPYLLRGAPRPSFTISDIDLDYGETATFTVGQAGAGGKYNVTLLGSVASTHGNSMGQRSIVPAVSCSGKTCTFKAPPNENVCPPAWFQMFVLDNAGTPSNATWIRIGGDRAQLGNWPAQVSGITPPGMGQATPLY